MNNNIMAARLEKLRSKMLEKGADGALVCKRENYIYLSGFTGTSAYLVITRTNAILLTDFRYVEQASGQAPLFKVVKYEGSILAALSDILKKESVSKLGFEDGYVTYEKYVEYSEKLDLEDLVPLGDVVEKLRLVKDTEELETIKKAVEIADYAFKVILKFIKPGVSELEVAAELEYQMKKLGASGPSFQTIVASGKRSALPHGVASEKKIEMGDAVTMDYGALYKDYCSDMTRTVFVGEPDEKLKKIYSTVLEAQLKSLDGAKAGLIGKQVDAVARDIIAAAGYGQNFGHGLGHGVGLEIHEEPRLSPSGGIIIEDNMAVTVEPGIYVNGLGGVRIEDIIIINGTSPVKLTQSPKEMIVL